MGSKGYKFNNPVRESFRVAVNQNTKPQKKRKDKVDMDIIVVDKDLLRECLNLANGDVGRLEIVSPTEIIVHNRKFHR